MKVNFVLFIFLSIFLIGCSFQDPITRSQNLSKKGDFKSAINILEGEYKKHPTSIPVKSLLAQAYSDYGLALCQDTNKPPKEKYPMAKQQFKKALELNPYLLDAKEMYEMIEKIQDSISKNKVE